MVTSKKKESFEDRKEREKESPLMRKLKTLSQLVLSDKKKSKGRGLTNLFYKNIYWNLLRFFYSFTFPNKGMKIMEEDWDYLIILDACRYDLFKEINEIPGKLLKKISRGSETLDWAKRNFTNRYEDVIYISTNPRISHHEFKGFKGSSHFFKVDDVWDYGWDDELDTVLPEKVSESAIKMKKRYPKKRMIIHYIQPHAPFVASDVIEGRKRWEDLLAQKVSLEKIKEAYTDNLKFVLREVKKLVKNLDGKTVITSDHGECFGEKFIIEHPPGIYVKKLVEVPWLIVEKTNL